MPPFDHRSATSKGADEEDHQRTPNRVSEKPITVAMETDSALLRGKRISDDDLLVSGDRKRIKPTAHDAALGNNQQQPIPHQASENLLAIAVEPSQVSLRATRVSDINDSFLDEMIRLCERKQGNSTSSGPITREVLLNDPVAAAAFTKQMLKDLAILYKKFLAQVIKFESIVMPSVEAPTGQKSEQEQETRPSSPFSKSSGEIHKTLGLMIELHRENLESLSVEVSALKDEFLEKIDKNVKTNQKA